MRPVTYVWLLPLILAVSAAFAQSGTPPAASSETWLAEEQSRFAQCMKDWDAKTHTEFRTLKGHRLPLVPVNQPVEINIPFAPATDLELADGCESLVSSLAHSQLARIAGRCVS